MPEAAEAPPIEGDGQQQEQTFTQADVDRIIRDRVKREREKFADYDSLKAAAEGAKTAEQRIADLEQRLADADAKEKRAQLVARIAGEHKITDPDDIRLFLTASDEDTLTAQAKRLAERDAARRKAGDVVPDAGKTPTNASGDPEIREFARQLFEKE